MKKLIIHTDLGGDPDDFVAICYLIQKGVNIKLLSLCPGTSSQVRIAQYIRQYYGLNFPISSSSYRLDNIPRGRHDDITKGFKSDYKPDLRAEEVKWDCDFLGIGPLKGIPKDLSELKTIVLQGGFCPYSVYQPKKVIDKFIGKESVPSFNPGGHKKNFLRVASLPSYIVGKNVCHRYYLKDSPRLDGLAGTFANLLSPNKKMHDLLAAQIYLDPSIGIFINGHVLYKEGQWTTVPDPSNRTKILVDLI